MSEHQETKSVRTVMPFRFSGMNRHVSARFSKCAALALLVLAFYGPPGKSLALCQSSTDSITRSDGSVYVPPAAHCQGGQGATGGNSAAGAIGAAVGAMIQGLANSAADDEGADLEQQERERNAAVDHSLSEGAHSIADCARVRDFAVRTACESRFNKVSNRSITSAFDTMTSAEPRAETVSKQYRVATGCLAVKKVDNTMFGSIMVNNCSYKVLFTFCTVSPKQSGSFSCARKQFGSDALEPHRSTGLMGIGIPQADDPFRVAFGGCEYPGIAHITRINGEKISMVCK